MPLKRGIAVIRPEPGNAATCARVRAAGLEAIALPLFAVIALPWSAPEVAAHDALLLTSANTLRHGGPALDRYKALPVLAVGETTAAAARAAGFAVVATGTSDAAGLLALAKSVGVTRALHLGGRDRSVAVGGPVRTSVAVYESAPLPIGDEAIAQLHGAVILLHSARAAARIAELVSSGAARAATRVAAFSPAVANAAGAGWGAVAIADSPGDAALIAAARGLVD